MPRLMDLQINHLRLIRNTNRLSSEDRKIVKKAYQFAKKSHAKQRRDEGPPYIIHPIRMANILMSELDIKNSDMIAAVLLHDVVEDTPVKMSQIKKDFGNNIYKLVSGLTRYRPKKETEKQKKNNKRLNYKKIMKGSKELRLLKGVDNLDNLRSWLYIPDKHPSEKKFPRWIQEAKNYYIPLAKMTNRYLHSEIKKAYGPIKKLYDLK